MGEKKFNKLRYHIHQGHQTVMDTTVSVITDRYRIALNLFVNSSPRSESGTPETPEKEPEDCTVLTYVYLFIM
jgi:hypothetical protein